jgi:hypothetical protein
MATKRIKDLSTSITSFRTGDVIPVDGPNGTAKMPYADLLKAALNNNIDWNLNLYSVSRTIPAGSTDSTFFGGSKEIPTGSVVRITPKPTNSSVITNYRVWNHGNSWVDVPVSESYIFISDKTYPVADASQKLIQLVPFDFVKSGGSAIGGVVDFDIQFIDATNIDADILLNANNLKEIDEKVYGTLTPINFSKSVFEGDIITGGSLSYYQRGRVINSFDSTTYWSRVYFTASEGEKYLVKTRYSVNTTTRPIVLALDSDDALLYTFGTHDTGNTEEEVVSFTAPKGTAKILFVCFSNLSDILSKAFVYKVDKTSVFDLNDVPEKRNVFGTALEIQAHADGYINNSKVGTTITFSTTNYYQNLRYDVNAGKKYIVSGYILAGISGGAFVAECDSSDKIIKVHKSPSGADVSKPISISIKTTSLTERIYVNVGGNATNYGTKAQVVLLDETLVGESDVSADVFGKGLNAYYNDYMPLKLSAIQSLEESSEKTFSFVFLTDSHWNYNSLQSKYICKELMDKTRALIVIHGGDFARAYGTEASLQSDYDETRNFVSVVGRDNLYILRGNHDFTIKASASASTGTTFTSAKTMACIRKGMRYDKIEGPLGTYYCVLDFKELKLLLVCWCTSDTQSDNPSTAWGVDYSISQEQLDWVKSQIVIRQGYKIVFLSHISGKDGMVGGYSPLALPIETMLQDVNGGVGDYAGLNNRVFAWFTGHSHHDQIIEDGGVAYVGTTCDASTNDDGIPRAQGTTDEQAVDYVMVDFDALKIKTIRVGGGQNREASFTL